RPALGLAQPERDQRQSSFARSRPGVSSAAACDAAHHKARQRLMSAPAHRPAGLLALSAFFLFGCLVSLVTAAALLTPNGPLEPIWRLNPVAHASFEEMGPWALLLMLAVGTACGAAA